MTPESPPPTLRFGRFELDRGNGELRRGGIPVRIQEKPLRLLLVLAERPGVLITRAELQKRLWPDDTFVDFEDGLNTAVRKLREALGDEADRPRFIETVPRRGYRLLAASEPVPARPPAATPVASPPPAEAAGTPPLATGAGRGKRVLWLAATGLLVVATAAAAWLFRARSVLSASGRTSVLIADFENQTGEARFDQALETAFRVGLEQSSRYVVFPPERTESLLPLMRQPPTARITVALGRAICRREAIGGLIAASITRTGRQYAITAELIDPASGETLRSYAARSDGEDRILAALDLVARDLRHDLGESLYEIHADDPPLPAVTTASLVALKDYADGRRLWHTAHFDAAMTMLRAAVAADPDFAMAHAALASGYCSYIYWRLADCRREYAAALAPAAHVGGRERMIIAANQADDLDRFDAADTLYRTYLQRYPDDTTLRGDYARLLRRHGRAAAALAQYRRLLRIAPDDARTYIELATAANDEQQYAQALGAYARAFQLAPQWLTAGNINREYGFTLVLSGAVGKAEQVFAAELPNPATRENGLRSLGTLDLWEGRYASARQSLQQALATDRERRQPFAVARVHFLLAVAAAGEGDRAGQLAHLDAAAAELPRFEAKVQYGSLLGQAYARAGAVAKAEKLYAAVAPLAELGSREHAGYLRLLHGEILLAQGHAGQAIAAFGLPDAADGLSIAALTAEALAHAYQQEGQRDAAIAWYRQVVASNGLVSWEPQQRLFAADYELASDEWDRGDRAAARAALAPLLVAWKNGDPSLPLRRQALALDARLAAPPQ